MSLQIAVDNQSDGFQHAPRDGSIKHIVIETLAHVLGDMKRDREDNFINRRKVRLTPHS